MVQSPAMLAFFPSISSSTVQGAPQEEITISIQTLWPEKPRTQIKEKKNTELDGFCQRKELQQRQSYSRMQPFS